MSHPARRNPSGAAVRVVVVDDSRLMRELLQSALTEAGDIKIVGAAANPHQAREVIRATNPDVVTLDVEMPSMGGLEFLRRIMDLRPMPVVMVAGSTTAGAETTLTALEIGAVDFVAKPSGPAGWDDFAATVRYKVREASNVRFSRCPVRRQPVAPDTRMAAQRKSGPADRKCAAQPAAGPDYPRCASGAEPAATGGRSTSAPPRCDLIAVGASTGGVTAINRLLTGLTDAESLKLPPMVIAQHMPQGFTARFAERLARTTGLDVAEASGGEVLRAGMIRIAPGERHLRVQRQGDRVTTQLGDDPPVNGHRPSVDVLFASAAEALGRRATGVILTGMGSDGAKGLMKMRAAGAHTLGEAERSCTVYGMPKAAMRLGAVAEELEIDCLAAHLCGQITGAYAAPETMR